MYETFDLPYTAQDAQTDLVLSLNTVIEEFITIEKDTPLIKGLFADFTLQEDGNPLLGFKVAENNAEWVFLCSALVALPYPLYLLRREDLQEGSYRLLYAVSLIDPTLFKAVGRISLEKKYGSSTVISQESKGLAQGMNEFAINDKYKMRRVSP